VEESERGKSRVPETLRTEPRSKAARRMEALGDWAKTITIAVVLFLLIRTSVVEAFKIPTSSMVGTLLVGDFLLVNNAVYGLRLPGTELMLPPFAEPERGDVIVFHPPHEPDKNYVKRLVGVPSDTLEMRGKRLFLNGTRVYEPYARYVDDAGDVVHPDMEWQSNHLVAAFPRRYQPTRDNWGPLVVPTGQYFVLGDNRDNSEDSRYWGFVERDQIRGRPWLVYYSYQPSRPGAAPWLVSVRWSRFGTIIR
jgi:signal peptidase I